MNLPSEEQQSVIQSIEDGYNVLVDACAGSGKSTTILSCAIALPQYNFIQLTFNKLLQSEVQEKVGVLQIPNIAVYTFHGLAVKYYDSGCFNDMGIRKMLREQTPFRQELPNCDIVVLDETQDMTFVFFELMWKFCTEMNRPIQLLILGDEKQGLYGFKGSDTRFLTMGDFCWSNFPLLKSHVFCRHILKMSYRITNPMRDFLNKVMLGEFRLQSCKDGVPVVYIRRNMYDKQGGYQTIPLMIKQLMLEKNVKYDDFFILAHSVKSKNRSVQLLENLLVRAQIPVFVPNNDAKEDLDSRVIQNKVVFSTFHSAKGRQRKYVFVLGFDDSHFALKKTKQIEMCPNELYVACTRATEKLFVWESIRKDSYILPFLKYNHNQLRAADFVKFCGIPSGRKPEVSEKKLDDIYKKVVHPSEVIRFISESTLDIISPLVETMFETLQPANEELLDIPTVHETALGSCEEVSDLNGTVIPLMYFDRLRQETKEPILQKLVKQNMKSVAETDHPLLWDAVANMPPQCDTIADYLYMANLLTATQDLFYSRLNQIAPDDYQWITEDMLTQCFAYLDNVLKKECELPDTWKAEPYVIQSSDEIGHIYIDQCLSNCLQESNMMYRFSARADLITNTSLWELKCTSQLSLDHKLQLILYAWLYQMKHKEKKDVEHMNYFLYNIRTNEHLQLQTSFDALTTVVVEIIKNKYMKPNELTDEEFRAQFVEKYIHNVDSEESEDANIGSLKSPNQ